MSMMKAKLKELELSDTQSKFWDVFIKFLGVIGGLVAFLWGIWQFKTSSERDFKKEYYNEQLKAMSHTVDIISALSSYPDTAKKFKEATLELDKLRSGELVLFSDHELNDLVGKFYADINIFLTHDGSIDKVQLKNESNTITKYCQKRIQNLANLYHGE